uniref:DUF3008 domain-containing protein n=1 Tax=viral metagenome TaxID=1070528 RepID=A0A6M3K5L8_9ZZZZ
MLPAKSKSQQRLMAMAKHSPSKIKKKNRGVLKMTDKQLSEYAKTKTKDLPKKVSSKRKKKR